VEGKGRGKGRKGRGGDPTPSRPLIHISGYAPDHDLDLEIWFRGHSMSL